MALVGIHIPSQPIKSKQSLAVQAVTDETPVNLGGNCWVFKNCFILPAKRNMFNPLCVILTKAISN